MSVTPPIGIASGPVTVPRTVPAETAAVADGVGPKSIRRSEARTRNRTGTFAMRVSPHHQSLTGEIAGGLETRRFENGRLEERGWGAAGIRESREIDGSEERRW